MSLETLADLRPGPERPCEDGRGGVRDADASATIPMPPAGATPPTAAEIAAF